MINTLMETVTRGTTISLASSTSACIGETTENLCGPDEISGIMKDSIGTSYMGSSTSSTSIPTTAVTAIVGQSASDFNTVQAVTYIETCSNEEVNDMINEIDELLDENTNNDVKTLGRRI